MKKTISWHCHFNILLAGRDTPGGRALLADLCDSLVSSGGLLAEAGRNQLTFLLHLAHLGIYNQQAMWAHVLVF